MKGVSATRWPLSTRLEVEQWLEDMYGPQSLTTWYIDTDYGITDLVMNEEIFTIYSLRWGHL
jgi:hypothetical protein